MESLRKSHKPPPQCCDERPRARDENDKEKKKLVLLFHDESIYNPNEGQTWTWGREKDRLAKNFKNAKFPLQIESNR